MIILLAVLVYAARDDLLAPLVDTPSGNQNALRTAGGEPMVGRRSDEIPPKALPLSQRAPGALGARISSIRSAVTIPANEGREPSTEIPSSVNGSPKPRKREDGHISSRFPGRSMPGMKRGHIRRNSSLYIELTKLGVSSADVTRMARAARRTWNLRRVRPGQAFAVHQNAHGGVDSLDLSIARERQLVIRRAGNNRFRASLENTPYTVTWHVTSGTIHHSVFASLKRQNAETELAGYLDEIFGWTIDFIRDIRAGDSFTIYYQRRHYPDGSIAVGNIISARVVNRGQTYYAIRFHEANESPGYYDLNGSSLQKSLRRAPLKLTRVTSNFSGRRFHPIYKMYMPHYGVDYGAPRGTPVYATGDGVVVAARRRRGNGNYVKIRHNNTYTTYYLHLNGFARGIRSGKTVTQGQVIGYVGSTGAATAPHVCYRVKRNGIWVNPRRLKLPSRAPVPANERAAFVRVRDACLARMQDALSHGLQDGTVAVEQPSTPASAQMRTLF